MGTESFKATPPEFGEQQKISIEKVLVAGNIGTCGGVESTLRAVEQIMDTVPQDVEVWTSHAPVNFPKAFEKYGEKLRNANDDISNVPNGAVFIVSAHGAPPSMFEDAARRDIFLIDTTCPFVLDGQKKVRDAISEGKHPIFIGEERHPETIGVKGQVKPEEITVIDPAKGIGNVSIPDNGVVFAKTTYAPDEIEETVAQIKAINPNIDASAAHSCYALHNRHLAGRELVEVADFWLVVGDESSHNARGIKNIGEKRNIPSALVTGPEEINWSWFGEEIKTLGVSAAASVPKEFIEGVLNAFSALDIPVIRMPQVVPESYRMFRLPKNQLDALMQRR